MKRYSNGGRGRAGPLAWTAILVMYCIAMHGALAAQAANAIAPAPAWVDVLDVPVPGEHANADRVMLLVDTQVSLLGDEPEWYFRRVSAVRTSAGVTSSAEFSVGYDPAYASAAIHGAWVTRDGVRSDRLADARIETLRREEGLGTQLLDGQLTLHVVLDDVRVGDIVEYAVSRRGDNPVHGGNFAHRYDFALGLPTQLQRFRMLRPATRVLERRLQGDGVEHTEQARGNAVDERWQRRDVVPLRSEERTPAWYSDGPVLELTSMASWGDVVDWALPLYASADAPEIAALAEDLGIAQGRADDAGILAAIRFVQDEIRYTGLELGAHAYAPYAPGEVLRRRYGDCKDKAQLLTGLLRYMGVRAAPALVNTQLRERIEDRMPTPHAFDHVIVRFEHDGVEHWVDATVARQRGDLDNREPADFGVALLLAPGEVELRETHTRERDDPRIDIDEVLDLRRPDGGLATAADYTIATTYRGRNADNVRDRFAGDTAESIGDDYTAYVAQYYPGSVMVDVPRFEDDPVANTLTVHEHYRVENLWESSGKGGGREATFWLSEIDRALKKPSAGKRRTPWQLDEPQDIRQHLTVYLDGGWPTEDSPLERLTTHLDYSGFTRSDGTTLHMEGRLRTFGGSVPAPALAGYRRDVARIEDTLAYTLTYTPGAGESDDATDAEADDPAVAAPTPSLLTDWRMLPLLCGIVLLWVWVIACARSRSVSARWGMLFRPRATVRAGIVVWRPWTVFLLLVASNLAIDVIDFEVHELHESIGTWFFIVALLALSVLSYAIAWLLAALMAWVGRLFGGHGSTTDVITAMAWAKVPVAAVLPLSLLALLLYGIEGLTWSPRFRVTSGMVLWLAAIGPMVLWSTLIWFAAFAAAQRFSIARAVWVSFLPGVVVLVVAIAAITAGRSLGGPG